MPEFVRLFVKYTQYHHHRVFWKGGAIWDGKINVNEFNNLERGKKGLVIFRIEASVFSICKMNEKHGF